MRPARFDPINFIVEASVTVDKVITTMVIRPLDDRTYCPRSAFDCNLKEELLDSQFRRLGGTLWVGYRSTW